MGIHQTMLVVLLVAAVHLCKVEGYGGGPPESQCNGKTQCTFNNRTGVEFAVDPSANSSDIVCKFGQTSLDSLPSAYCDVPCDATTVYECACVSQSVASKILVDEGALDTALGVVALLLVVPTLLAYKRVMNKAKKERELLKLDGYQDNTSPNCLFGVLFIGLVGFGAAFLANGIALSSRQFWEGCGDF